MDSCGKEISDWHNLAIKSRAAAEKAVAAIDNLNFITESSFSRIGNSLNTIYMNGKSITEFSIRTAGTIQNDILEGGILDLKRAVEAASNQIDHSEVYLIKSQEILHSVALSMEAIIDSMEPFGRIVKHLRILGISTKIEDARNISIETGFDILADNVESLSNSISEKSNVIRKSTVTLLSEVRNVLIRIDEIRKKHIKIKSRVLSGLNDSLEVLNKKFERNLLNIKEITGSSQEISLSIGNIVMALQFQDIIRQQTSHVKEILLTVNDKTLNEIHTTEEIASPANQETLNLICSSFMIQAAQLKHSEAELSQAVNGIRNGLINLRQNVNMIYSDTEGLISDLQSGDNSELRAIQKSVKSISTDLLHIQQFNTELYTSIEPLIETIIKLTAFMEQINELGSGIGLISMNASIKAARIGAAGAALGVLSEEIRHLSVNAEAHSTTTSELLIKVQESVRLLNKLLEENNSSECITSGQYSAMEALISRIDVNMSNSPEQLIRIKSLFQELINGISNILAGIDEYEDNIQTCRGCDDLLNELVLEIKSLPGFVLSKKSNSGFLTGNYTMDSERIVYNKIMGLQESDDKDGFSDTGYDFGDNVELF